jgi:subtilisin family serine protease
MNTPISRGQRGRSIYLLVALVGLSGLMWGTTTSSSSRIPEQAAATAKIAPQVLADTRDGKSASVVIVLASQANVSAGYEMKDQDARGWFVYNTLIQHSARTQSALQSFLKAQGVTYQSFWAVNMIVADADLSLVESIAARPDVARIDSNRPSRWIEDPVIANSHDSTKKLNAPEAAEWGVLNVNAPTVWGLGFTGAGIVIGNQDTGMRWTHNALKPKYRGWNGSVANHNYNWHDAIHSGGGVCGANSLVPCDDQGHGTHTTGTTTGDDGAGNQVGVAPGARWIGCRNMDQGNGTPATYTECFQFFIAPTDLTGSNPNPSLRPHVINNSWGCPAVEGCTTRAELETIVNNTEAAGIFVEASAGNAGPNCSTVADPPAIYSASFSTGAIDISNILASFSSRGPSTFYTPNLLKPNISAPGVNVRSALRTGDSSYGTMSGTSMAGPHVAGVVALLWSARPQLSRNIAQTKFYLQSTASPAVTVTPQTCGGIPSTQIPNNSFGWGRVDALAAVNAAPTAASAEISGSVTDQDGEPIPGVTINLSGQQSRKTITDSHGNYRFANVDTSYFYTVTPSLVNYHFGPESRSFSLNGNNTAAAFTATRDAVMNGYAIDTSDYFVRQQYLDFLGREPNEEGFAFWTNNIESCGGNAECRANKRTETSAAFFLSIEFQQTGYLVYRMYQSAYGAMPGAPVAVGLADFQPDSQAISNGVIVNRPGWEALLESNKTAFAVEFVQRARFTSAYPNSLTPDQFVDNLFAHAGVIPSNSDRAIAIAEFDGAATSEDVLARGRALRQVAENPALAPKEFNKAFVLMQYFGYLRRDANAPPDGEYAGFTFWLDKLNQFNGDFRRAEMVKAFLVSGEYRQRFPR